MAGDQSIFATITFNACVCPLALLALEYLRTRYVDIYSPLSRSRGGEVPSARFLGWVPQVLALSDDRMLQLAGLDGYVLLRFLRFGFRLCFVCSLGSAVLLPLYYHAEHFGDTAGTGTDLISSLSMGHVAMDGALLWAPFFFMYAFTGAFLYLIHQEYDNFVLARNKFLKSNFHTHQQPLSEQTQTEHTVRVVNLPANYTSHKLAAFFEAFYPGEVLFAHVVRPAPALEYWAAQRGRAQRQLEDAVARREAGASTTRMRMGRSGGQVRGGWECCPSGAYRLVDSPRGEAEEVDAVTYWADQLLLACVEVAAQQREVRAQEEEIDRRDGIEGAAGPSTGAGAGAGAGASVKAQGTSALVEAGAAEAGVREVKGKGQKGKEEKGGKGDKHWRPWSRAKKNAVPVLTPTVTATGTATATGTGAGVGGGTGAGGGGSRLMFEMGSILAGDRGTDQYGDRDRDGGRDYGERGGYGDGEVGEYGDGEDVYTFGGGPVGTGYTADADEGDADMEGVGGQGGQGQGGRGMGMFGGLGGLGLGLLTHKAGGTGAYAAGAGKAKGNMGKASVNNMGSVGNLGNLGNMGWVGGSQCGFVTFSTRRAQITATRLGMFSESHPHLRVLPAPSPSDILWENQSVSPERVQGMALITGGAFYFALGGWSVVLAFVAALSNLQTFEGLIPQLRQLRILGGLPYALLQGLLPVLVLMVLNGVIGGVLRGVAEGVERRQSRSEVQLRVFRW
ncbi:late exocytosis, associated with Golgi transport-domain-containing protein [Ochromonadaceae sp. CCMP2298]|nr:late exocytosis, associated with Golgi transport-domain-containing protein [Ochromonadaceae sp. CCMP2298]